MWPGLDVGMQDGHVGGVGDVRVRVLMKMS